MSNAANLGNESEQNTDTVSTPPIKDWTIMIYMAGDNNLSDDMITSLNNIKSSVIPYTSGTYQESKIAFLAQYDCEHPAVKTRRFDFLRSSDPILGFPPLNTPEKSVLDEIKGFLKWAVQERPANNYALIISGHSDAFQGRTLLVDENPGGATTIKDLNKSLIDAILELKAESIAKKIDNPIPKMKLDILGFESCVMNTLEVIYQFSNTTDTWIGSQGSIPNFGWNYENIVKDLILSKNTLTAKKVAKIIIKNVKAFHFKYAFGGRSVDISAINLEQLPNFLETFSQFTILLFINVIKLFPESGNENFDFSNYPILRLILMAHWKCQTYMHDQSIDLGDFCKCLKLECENYIREFNPSDETDDTKVVMNSIIDACQKVLDELNGIDKIVFKGATTGAEYQFSKGISMFFPWSRLALIMSKTQYKELDFINDNTIGQIWFLFIAYFTFLTQRPMDSTHGIIDDFNQLFSKLIEILTQTKTLDLHGLKETSEATVNLSELIFKIIELVIETRDDHISSRGTIDNLVAYFSNPKNVCPTKLEISSDF